MVGNPGRKNRFITIERPTEVNDLGSVTKTWSTLATVWAEERPLRAEERYLSEGKHSVRVSNFRIYYRSDITELMELVYAGRRWRITGIAPVDTLDQELDITAEAYG
jgi:SPP1 family predicted phage head-tail adaptor